MMQETTVTLSENLDLAEIRTDGSFEYNHVLDLRCSSQGHARPVEEAVLKRLRNHFISYDQIPLAGVGVSPCQEVHFCETANELDGKTLVLCDDVASVATLLGIYGISFDSKVFYLVETGKGNYVKSIPDRHARVEPYVAAVAM